MTVELDPLPVRALTSREIAKVLASIIGGVVAADHRARHRVAIVIAHVRARYLGRGNPIEERNREFRQHRFVGADPCWEVALLATVAGLRGWCNPKDVATAIDWVDANLPLVLGEFQIATYH